ncbi:MULTISPECIES: hypothetical protein [unclassified Streptomyces]|uniref:hypothetical protein n=1 Tax=unclassified Streptomyces TaxID=2593676 RepID=UPI000DBA952E|nr:MULTISPECIES: hypothetical protein [unclassified Streptomyces]MYT68654.1 hypothetical protein [Streptomyces sp. SID8367]RAJ86325.1 hypothetical protein K377_03173 [Streptomyces sp. PsTaAH-137]
MRGVRTAGSAVSAAVLLVLVTGGSAQARPVGPGSADVPDLAVVIAPGAEAGPSVSLHYEDPDFARLERLTAEFDAVTEPVPSEWDDGDFPPVEATIVWGMTGVGGWPETRRAPGTDTAIERQDQLVVAADGTPWIRTDPMVDVNDDDLRWHRVSPALVTELRRAGVFPPERADAHGGVPLWDRVLWALGGLLVGLAAAAWWFRGRLPRFPGRVPREPRQQLVG